MINQLTLENFKCFDTLDLKLAPLTLITGVNGMGKSSVIQSLLMLRQSADTRYLQTENKVLLTGELVNLVSGNAIRYVPAPSPTVKIALEHGNDKNFSCSIQAESKMSLLDCTTEGLSELSAISLFDEQFLYISAERLGPRPKYPKKEMVLIKHNGRLGSGGGELTASFLQECLRENTVLPILKLKHPTETSELIFQNVSAWLSEITYDGAQVAASDLTSEQLELIYSFNKGKFKGFDFSPLNVGFGFSYVLPVILAILSAKPGSLILIENPEAHLHPAAQSKIGKLLALAADNGVQIIIETHSDHLLNGIRVIVKGDESLGKVNPENIIVHYFASISENGTETRYKEEMKIHSDGRMDDWPPGFFDEWEINLRKIVL